MRKTLFIVWMMLTAICGWAQQTTVNGTVVDTETRKPVAGASVTAGRLSVVTNEDGFFILKSDQTVEAVVVSHLGYRSQRISIDGQQASPLQIMLKPATVQLTEVLVTAYNARELVLKAISRIPKNYSKKEEMQRCFYREKVMKRQNYISVAEGVLDMYKTGYQYGSEHDRTAIRKGRRLLSPKLSDTLTVKVMGGPATALSLDVVKNPSLLLNDEELNLYELKMETPATIADRRQYVVSIAPRATVPYALYFGRLYIDQETLAFTRAELELDMSDREKATSGMLVKKPRGLRFKPKELSCIVDYRTGEDGLTRISYMRNTFRFNCDWKRRLFATSFSVFCEMAVTDTSDHDVRPIRGRDSFDQRDAFFDKVDYFRDPAFWQDYNIIEPTESLDNAINKLLKKYR
jgi:hypothetical protein